MANRSIEQEALERMTRMYSAVQHTPTPPPPPNEPKKAPPSPPEEPPHNKPHSEPPPEYPAQKGLLQTLLKENEQGLLLIMMALLLGENTSPELLLAILYLLL